MKSFEISGPNVERHRAWSDRTFGPRKYIAPDTAVDRLLACTEGLRQNPYDLELIAKAQLELLDVLHRSGHDAADLDAEIRHVLAGRPILPSPKIIRLRDRAG